MSSIDTLYVPPAFMEGKASTEEIAKRAASMWLSNPANKMQLPQNVALADADGGGTIDKSEFGDLLAQSGITAGGNDMAALFAEADKDGDGELTVDEIKTLGDRNRNKFKAQN